MFVLDNDNKQNQSSLIDGGRSGSYHNIIIINILVDPRDKELINACRVLDQKLKSYVSTNFIHKQDMTS